MVGNICDKEAVSKALSGVDYVLHLAAYQDYLPDFSTFFQINATGTALLYEVMVERRLPIQKVVVASSQAVYGEGQYLCGEHGLLRGARRTAEQLDAGDWEIRCGVCRESMSWRPTDESVVSPENQYALSKHTEETIAFNLGERYGIPTTCLRYSITQGPWQSPRNAYSGICRILTLRARVGKPLVLYEDGRQVRDYVHVRDVASANVLTLENSSTDFKAYNVGGGRVMTAFEYAETVSSIVNDRIQIVVPGYYRFGDTRHIVSDTDGLRAVGWEPVSTVESAIGEYDAWASAAGLVDESTDAGIDRMLGLGALRRVSVVPTS
jgi:dTDP-L-rhamnose 4-epimerase